MKILLALSLLGAVYWAAAQQSELHRLLAIGSNKVRSVSYIPNETIKRGKLCLVLVLLFIGQ